MEVEAKLKHFGTFANMFTPKSVNLLDLARMQTHEILEKMTHSLNRKFKRNQDWGMDVRESTVYEIVVKMRHCFDKNYGLSRYVENTLEEIDWFYKIHTLDEKTGNWVTINRKTGKNIRGMGKKNG